MFLDLTAAYNSVWHKGLHLNLIKCIRCKHMTDFIMDLLYTRSFVLSTSDGHKSKPFRLKNGVAQGSELAPTLYNICTSDFSEAKATRYMYADDVALTASANTFKKAEKTLTDHMSTISTYLRAWRLKLSVSKSVASVFRLRNHLANHQL